MENIPADSTRDFSIKTLKVYFQKMWGIKSDTREVSKEDSLKLFFCVQVLRLRTITKFHAELFPSS